MGEEKFSSIVPLQTTKDSEFKGVDIDTGTNNTSIISTAQYLEYCPTFGITNAIE